MSAGIDERSRAIGDPTAHRARFVGPADPASAATALSIAGAVMMVFDHAGRIVHVNRACEELTGRSSEDLVGRGCHEIFSVVEREGDDGTHHGERAYEGRMGEWETMLSTGDGQLRHIVWRTGVVDSDADTRRLVVAVGSDVTDQRRAEEDATRVREAFAHAPIGMAVVSADPRDAGRFLQVNHALAEMTGHSESELTGLDTLGLSLPETRPTAGVVRSAAWADGWSSRFDHPAVRADGTPIWVRVSLSAIWDPQGCLRHYVCQVEDISEYKQAEAELLHRTLHDPLTGLANRELLTDHLEWALARAARSGDSIAVLFVDLDGFKRVNDTFGHDAGDEVLKESGRRIKAALRAVDTVGRFGGDEFVIVCEGPISHADARVVSDRIERVLSKPFDITGGVAQIGASVGAVVGKVGAQSFDLLRDADWDMYRVKEAHRATLAGKVAISSAARQARLGARRARQGRRVS